MRAPCLIRICAGGWCSVKCIKYNSTIFFCGLSSFVSVGQFLMSFKLTCRFVFNFDGWGDNYCDITLSESPTNLNNNIRHTWKGGGGKERFLYENKHTRLNCLALDVCFVENDNWVRLWVSMYIIFRQTRDQIKSGLNLAVHVWACIVSFSCTSFSLEVAHQWYKPSAAEKTLEFLKVSSWWILI